MKRAAITVAVLAGVGAFSLSASADQQVQHYEAKPSETLEQAVKNFSEYNQKLSEILAKDEITAQDMDRIHQLTYTLEVALAKINEDMQQLPATLETLHLASEALNKAKVRGVGDVYLEIGQTVVD